MSKRPSKERKPPRAKGITLSSDEEDEEIDQMEADPRFQEFMDEVDEAQREGRTISHDGVIEPMHAARPARR
jgi:hypothetical protein